MKGRWVSGSTRPDCSGGTTRWCCTAAVTSRLLGRDHSLVLHGGGNTSVKIRERNLFGDEEDILYVKGSGWDLETIEPARFAPVRLNQVRRLATLQKLTDQQMVEQLRLAT